MFIPSAAAAQADPSPICTDRPAKANAVCTVPKGVFQVETNAAGWSLTKTGGARTELLTLGSTFVKLGLSDRSDLEAGFAPFAQVTTKTGGSRVRISGFGDVVVRYKHRLSGDDAKVKVGVIPFVKLPTAKSGLGNRKLEGGVALPVSFGLGSASMTFGPEFDLLADADGRGRHAALVNLVNIATPVTDKLTLGAELWSNFNFDPQSTVRQASIDGFAAYLVSSNVQIDGGVNIGLTRDTPDFELYAGVSVLFGRGR